MKYYLAVLKKYATFGGRASRAEYWVFVLLNLLLTVLLFSIDLMINFEVPILSSLYSLFVLLPSLAVAIRRLHDTNRSGWWILISLVPFVGSIILFVFMVLDSTAGQNQFGPNPKEVKPM